LKFYPDEPLKFPAATVNTRQQLLVSADSLLGALVQRFEQATALVKQARLGIQALRNGLTQVYQVIEQQFKP
ncbi:DNA circularization protein, partial [Pseudomonas reactans]